MVGSRVFPRGLPQIEMRLYGPRLAACEFMVKPFSITVAFTILGAGFAACGSADHEEAQASADRWANERSRGWELAVDDRDPQRALAFGPSASRCTSSAGSTSVRYTAPGYQILLGFKCLAGRP